MKKIKFLILFFILFIAIGFATVSISLSIEGNTDLAGDIEDFKVYYSDVIINGEQDLSIVYSNTKLDFSTLLQDIGESYVIDYDVTNASKYFDAQITMSCTSSSEYLLVQNEFDTTTNLEARSTRTGKLTLKKLKSIASYDSVFENISCSMVATPVERDSVGSGEVPTGADKYMPMLLATSADDTSAFRADDYRGRITAIKFEDQINIPDEAEESWDISKYQDGSVMAYVIDNADVYYQYVEDDYIGDYWQEISEALDLVIQSNGQVYANQDMSHWFANMSNLTSISGLENLNTVATLDMSYMFVNSSDAEYGRPINLDLSSFDTSNVKDMSYMFYGIGGDYGNIGIDISSFNTSSVTNMSHMFAGFGGCEQGVNLDLSHFDTSKVTDMSGMFKYFGGSEDVMSLDNASTINISNFDTSKVTDMSYMFAGFGASNQAVTLDVSGFDTSNVTNMSHMFSYIGGEFGSLTIDVSGFDTSKVTDMSYMFNSVGGYTTTIDVSNFDTSNVTDMSYMLNYWGYYVEDQITLDVSGFDTSNVTNMSHAFGGINSNGPGIVLDVSNFDTRNVTNMSYVFEDAYDIIGIENIITDKVTDMSGMFYGTGDSNPDFILDLSNFNTSNVTDMRNMFSYAGGSSSTFKLDVSNFDTSKVTNMSGMFSRTGCASSTYELNISNFDTSEVTDMSYMFWGVGQNATALVLNLTNFDTSKVTDMQFMFAGVGENSETVELDLSSFDTSKVTNMNNMFVGVGENSSVLNLDLTSFDTSNVTNMRGMFEWTGAYNPNFTLQLDDSFDTSKVANMTNMFRNMGKSSTVLKFAITIRNPNTSYDSMFSDGALKGTGSLATLNYTSETETLVDNMIATKTSGANVVKGYNESVSIDFTVDGTSYTAYEGMTWDQWVDECDESGNFFVNSDDTVSYMLTGFEWADVGYDEAFAFTNIYGSDIIEAGKEYILDW